MNEKHILVRRNKYNTELVTAAVEGEIESLKDGLRKYLNMGRLKDKVDFTSILPKSGERNFHWFLVGNIYEPRVCTMTVSQYTERHPNTGVMCQGIGNIVIELLVDFAEGIELKTTWPISNELIEAVRYPSSMELLYLRSGRRIDLDTIQTFSVLGLKSMQEIYEAERILHDKTN